MRFEAEPSGVKPRRTFVILLGAWLFLAAAGGVGSIIVSTAPKPYVEVIGFFAIISVFAFFYCKQKRVAAKNLPSIELTDSEIIFLRSDMSTSIKFDSIKKVTKQLSGNEVKSLLINMSSGGYFKVDGYMDMRLLASELSLRLRPEQMASRRWLHR